jgi:hypothetical protein
MLEKCKNVEYLLKIFCEKMLQKLLQNILQKYWKKKAKQVIIISGTN